MSDVKLQTELRFRTDRAGSRYASELKETLEQLGNAHTSGTLEERKYILSCVSPLLDRNDPVGADNPARDGPQLEPEIYEVSLLCSELPELIYYYLRREGNFGEPTYTELLLEWFSVYAKFDRREMDEVLIQCHWPLYRRAEIEQLLSVFFPKRSDHDGHHE